MTRRFLLRLLSSVGISAVAGGASAKTSCNSYYCGPPSDHFDGRIFFNPGRPNMKSFGDLMRWRFASEGKEDWPDEAPSPHRDVPPQRVGGSALRVVHVGHASILYQTAGLNILVDPVWSDRASPVPFAGPKRVNAPGVAFEDLPPIDVVLVTHNHYDHLDVTTLGRLWAAHRPRIVTPLGNDAIMKAAVPEIVAETHDWGARVPLGDGVAVHFEECLHWSARGLFDRREALWAAFMVETPGGTIVHVGDTGFGDGSVFERWARKHPRIRLACLPIGAYEPRWFMKDQHVDPDEAVRIARILRAPVALGHHWGTFRLTDEGIDRPPAALAEARRRHGLSERRFIAMRPGQVWQG
jgi:L-ascorbate metabolism protein UlaG (beta-lactamase superfamily)